MLLKDKLKDKKIILASHSPRRREILAGTGLEFTVAEGYEVEEIFPADMPAAKVPAFLAKLKADAYPYPMEPGDILISADTTIVLEDAIIGKPKDRADAIDILKKLSGREHLVLTGVCIKGAGKTKCFSRGTRVLFRTLTDEEIEYYVDNYKPYDKAGAYGIQEWIGYVGVKGIKGSFYNVMGLPVQTLYVELEKFVDNNF